MIKVNGYASYDGGKSGNGTYQTLINHVPPHKEFYSLFLGNCGLTRHIKLPDVVLLNDIDPAICRAWDNSNTKGLHIWNCTALSILKMLQGGYIFDRYERTPESGFKMETYDPADRFVYLDPPYKMDTRKSQLPLYKFEMIDNDHMELLTQVTAMSDHKIMISHYPCELYDKMLHDWVKVDFRSMTRNGMAWERIYMNYKLEPGVLHDYRYLGGDFREREKNNRIKKNFVKKLKRLPTDLRNSIIQDLLADSCDMISQPGVTAK